MPTRTVGPYRLTKPLGIGMFSKVMLGIDDQTNQQYAVKVMRKDVLEDMNMGRYARREAAVLKKLLHPNIVKFVEAIQSDKKLFLVMEIAQGTELLDVVANGPLREPDARHYIRQIVNALGYIHNRGIAHRDLKPDNILVDIDTRTLKLIDFGMTALIRVNSVMRTSCGSSFYSAPEVTYPNGDGYDGVKADAWSLGIISYILLTGVHPFVDSKGDLMITMLKQGIVEYPDFLSRGSIHFLSRLLSINPWKRYSVSQVSLHPWLTGRPVQVITTASAFDDRPKLDRDTMDSDTGRFSGKRPGTFSGAQQHRTVFGRSVSDRNTNSSPSLAMRRRSSQKTNSGSFLWFRKQNTSQNDDRKDDGDSGTLFAGNMRTPSLDRSKSPKEGRGLNARGTFDLVTGITGRHSPNENQETSGARVRRQLSLSNRTRGLLMRGSYSSSENQKD